ncbi:hypothetical protein HCTV5_135 [Halovirus HCTV-5]|uniref:baseplate protein n=1 Tax=Halovirus HCTV-5 TaxID=1273748 RepID=UPI0003348498|nr:baseplate protein [Halovirus HCTV-5]AGM11741.1 hypothetical protein HCTV5_135 [Halovirus HCTV-5]
MPSAENFEWPQGNPLFEVQWRTVTESLAGNGIVNNGDFEVTATATDMQIQVAAGDAFYIGTTYTLGAAETHTLSDGDANDDRWDTVYFDTSTTSSGVREGTPAANPEPPDIQGGELLLAVVYVPAGATNISDQEILNWRAKFSNEAEDVQYDDGTGVYGVNNVDAALDELQEAAQITAYPLAQTDLATGSVGTEQIIDGDVANGDLANSTITVNAGTGLSTTQATISLGGSATISIPADGVTTTELADAVDLETMRSRDNSITGTLAALPEDGGDFGVLVDVSVTSTPAAGTVQRYDLGIDATDLLGIAAEADGAGSIQNARIPLNAALGLLAQSAVPGYSGQGAAFYDTDDETPKYANSGGTYQRPESRPNVEEYNCDESGSVAKGNSGVMYLTQVPDSSTFRVEQAGLLLADGQAAPTDLDLVIATLDNAGAASLKSVVIDGDGTIQNDLTGDPLASYMNNSGGEETVGLLVDNGNFNTGTGSSQDIVASAHGEVV